MYRKILVALDTTASDQELLPHITRFAALSGAQLLLLHVADGWVARNYDHLKLAESQEMKEDRAYLDSTAEKLRGEGLKVSMLLALGDPPTEILRATDSEKCDLIAMTSHGHRLIADLFFGSAIHTVRHRATVPLLIVQANK